MAWREREGSSRVTGSILGFVTVSDTAVMVWLFGECGLFSLLYKVDEVLLD